MIGLFYFPEGFAFGQHSNVEWAAKLVPVKKNRKINVPEKQQGSRSWPLTGRSVAGARRTEAGHARRQLDAIEYPWC